MYIINDEKNVYITVYSCYVDAIFFHLKSITGNEFE